MYSNDLICDILDYINKNINTKISINELETYFFYNKFYIMKLFKRELNITIIEYINMTRIYNSLLKMKNSNKKIIYVALNNGFYSIEYYSEIFKKIVGVNPQLVKKYFNDRNNVSIEISNRINNTLSNLYILKTKSEKYLSNRKPKKIKRKVLSIFK